MHHKWQSYDVSFLRYGAQQAEFFVILDRFLPFYPIMDPENQNFQEMKITPEDIIILLMRTINDSHMMYGSWDSWDMECNFLPFYPANNLKNQNFEKLRKAPWDIIILHKCTKNHDHMLYCSSDMAHNGCNYFSFGAIFCPFTSLTAQKIKI